LKSKKSKKNAENENSGYQLSNKKTDQKNLIGKIPNKNYYFTGLQLPTKKKVVRGLTL